jgi:hypothetical protein
VKRFDFSTPRPKMQAGFFGGRAKKKETEKGSDFNGIRPNHRLP